MGAINLWMGGQPLRPPLSGLRLWHFCSRSLTGSPWAGHKYLSYFLLVDAEICPQEDGRFENVTCENSFFFFHSWPWIHKMFRNLETRYSSVVNTDVRLRKLFFFLVFIEHNITIWMNLEESRSWTSGSVFCCCCCCCCCQLSTVETAHHTAGSVFCCCCCCQLLKLHITPQRRFSQGNYLTSKI